MSLKVCKGFCEQKSYWNSTLTQVEFFLQTSCYADGPGCPSSVYTIYKYLIQFKYVLLVHALM